MDNISPVYRASFWRCFRHARFRLKDRAIAKSATVLLTALAGFDTCVVVISNRPSLHRIDVLPRLRIGTGLEPRTVGLN